MTPEPSGSGRAKFHPRHLHRARHHESAHAEIDQTTHPVPVSPLIPTGHTWIDTQEALAELIAHIRSVGAFAYDSEFIGELSYFPQLCLLQVATTQRVALVDPMVGLELTPFWELLCDPAVEKIVHAGAQDLEPVLRLLNKLPVNIFDTQIAAGFVGLSYPPALSKLARQLLNVRLPKGFTFTHWDQRPLSNVQIRYAADDVRFLPAIRDDLARRLEAGGRTAWAKEECQTLCNPNLYLFDREADYLRIRGAGGLEPKNLAVLRELMQWRDQGAREADLPPRTFVKDEVLLEMARRPVARLEDLDRVKGLPRPVEIAQGPKLLEITQRAMALPASELPQPKAAEESPADKFRIDALFAAAQGLSMGRGIDPALSVSRADVSRFYRAMKQGSGVEELRIMRGWRRLALGDALVKMMRGEATITLSWENEGLRSQVDTEGHAAT